MAKRTAGRWLAAVAACGFACSAGAQAQARWTLTVRLDAVHHRLEVQGCSDAAVPALLLRAAGDAASHLRELRRGEETVDIRGRNRVCLQDWQPGECYRASVDLESAAASDRFRLGGEPGQWWRVPPALWLWRPRELDPDSRIAFELPHGWSVSAPWPPAPDGGRRLGATPDDWPAQTAFGRFEERALLLPGGRLRVSVLPLGDADVRRRIDAWFDATAPVLLAGDGQLPLADTQVLIVPVPGLRSPVPWGQVSRGGAAAVMLVVGADAGPAAWAADWTAAHELAHLQHPFLGERGRWLAEGLASYHQNVWRARSGLLTPAQAWEKLAAGFERGRASGAGDPLGRIGRTRGSTMRVYWSGAAYWLESDLALRAGGSSLDLVLARFRARHLPSARWWDPHEFIAELDRLAPAGGLLARYLRYRELRAFPDLAPALELLGRERLVPEGAESALSQAIMQARDGGPVLACEAARAASVPQGRAQPGRGVLELEPHAVVGGDRPREREADAGTGAAARRIGTEEALAQACE